MLPDQTPPSLPKKLGIKPGHTVCIVNPPAEFMETLGAEITQARIVRGIVPDADIIHAFVTKKEELETLFPELKEALGKPHALWISWPRPISGITTDLNENAVRDIGFRNKLVDVKVCKVDDDWSGLKFAYRLKDR